MRAQALLCDIRKNFQCLVCSDTQARLEVMVRLCQEGKLPECVYIAATGILRVLEERWRTTGQLQILKERSQLRRRLNSMRQKDLFKVVALAAEKCSQVNEIAGWLDRNVR
jgi:hypothetical protein